MKIHTAKVKAPEFDLILTIEPNGLTRIEGAPDWLTIKAIQDEDGKIIVEARGQEVTEDDTLTLIFNDA